VGENRIKKGGDVATLRNTGSYAIAGWVTIFKTDLKEMAG